MIQVFTKRGCKSTIKVKEQLSEIEATYIVRNLQTYPFTLSELRNILALTLDGVDEILADTKRIQKLKDDGIDISELTISELHHYICLYPDLIQTPIICDGINLMVGMRNDELDVFKKNARLERRKHYEQILNKLRAEENSRFEAASEDTSMEVNTH